MRGETVGEIIDGEAFIEMNDIPNVIEEEIQPNDPQSGAPEDILPADNIMLDVPPVILGLQAPIDFPENFLVEEFPEDMLMDGEENSEEEKVPDQPEAEQQHSVGLCEAT